MTVIYLREYDCRTYAVTFENITCVRVQTFEDILDYEKNILCVQHLGTILGESEICEMTKIFDGNTILLKISEKNDKHRWVYVSGDKECSFLANDVIYKYISNMGNSLRLYSIAISGEYNYFLTPYFKFIKREMINIDDLLDTNERSVDPYHLHVSRCGK